MIKILRRGNAKDFIKHCHACNTYYTYNVDDTFFLDDIRCVICPVCFQASAVEFEEYKERTRNEYSRSKR